MKKNSALDGLAYIHDWFALPSRFRQQASLPTILNLPITDNCNARCVMCDVWKNDSRDELTPSQLEEILMNKLFQMIRHVGISGGEPALRPDLLEHISVVLESLPALRSLSLTSHGFLTLRWMKFLPEISKVCSKKGVKFTFNLSIDGVGQIHDKIRRIPGGYQRVMKTLDIARSLDIKVIFQSTISRDNVYNLDALLNFARNQNDTEIDFRIATEIERLNNHISVKEVEVNEDQRSFFADFLDSRTLLDATPSPARRLFYKDLTKRLSTNAYRKAPCFYQNEGILLTAHGDLYHCSISSESIGNVLFESAYKLYFSPNSQKIRSELLNKKCPNCLHDQSGAWKPMMLVRETLLAGRKTRKLFWLAEAISLSSKAFSLLLRSVFLRPVAKDKDRYSTAMIIGAYGGEHVGDAAILGGVILRLQREFGINKTIVSSFRPDRTKRWVRSITLPIKIDVIDHKNTIAYLRNVDCVVWAGGPLMDLPRLLVAHLNLLIHANSEGKPFWLEGIGIGPFKLWLSKSLARTILRLASDISIRTKHGMSHPIIKGLNPMLSVDPAFDYLKTKNNTLVLSEDEKQQIDDLVKAEKYCIGVNLRPLWSKYLSSIDSVQAQKHFVETFAESLLRIQEVKPAKYIYFPMNSDQYGFSDFGIAQELIQKLPPNFPMKIWETEPNIDAVLALLRQLDLVIAMRFHACIFSLSQGLPTIGIDYSQGNSGKVRELFVDSGLEERVSGITDFQPAWLVNKVLTMANETKQ